MSDKNLPVFSIFGAEPSFRKVLRRSWVLLFWLFVTPAFAAESVAALLKQADAYRLPADAVRVEAQVEVYRDNVFDKDRQYAVYIKPGRRSLILMKSPTEVGQKMLMLADQFWLLMPDSQRPMRITATQKLLGEASSGDIASMTWSEDYDGTVTDEVDCPVAPLSIPDQPATARDRRCLKLDLAAARSGVTYARMQLYLEKFSKLPIKADLFVNSGKRAKEAWYFPRRVEGRLLIASMVLLDDIQHNRRTVIRYRSMVPKVAPDEFFNPAALIRNSLADW